MRKLFFGLVSLSLGLMFQTSMAARDLYILKAGLGSWGSSIKIHDCSTEQNSWVQFTAEVSNTGNPIAFQYRTNRSWTDAGPGQVIQGKTVRLRGKASGTRVNDDFTLSRRSSSGAGDFVNIRVNSSCIDDAL